MSEIITAVFKATVGWLVDKGRDEASKKLKDGDVTDQQFRGIIMREIDDMKSKLDGLSRKDLLASIGFFREGIELLYEVFEEKRSSSGYGADTAQAACVEAVSLAEGMKHLELTESATRKLSHAKKRFERARERATDAFSNEALSPNDRILAMQYRVMATVLETIDHPADAVAPCKVCIEELNGLPVVQRSFQEQLRTGIMAVKSLFNKEERRKVISGVCLVNRVAYDVTQTVHVKEPFTNEPFAKELLQPLPMIDTGKEKVDLLRDRRVTKILRKQGIENCSVPWILGHDGGKEHRLTYPRDIATNSSGQYIAADIDSTIKVYDSSGKFVQCFRLPPLIDDSGKELSIESREVQLATDMNDNIYVLVEKNSGEDPYWIFKFNKTTNHRHKFRVRTMGYIFYRCELSVSDSGTVMVLKSNWSEAHIVDVYETDGQFVCSFGEQILRRPCDITTVSDGRVMVVQGHPSRVLIFSEQGNHLNTFDLQISMMFSRIAFHRASQHVVVVGGEDYDTDILHIEIYTKDGEFVRSTPVNMGQSYSLIGMAVTTEGRIAVATRFAGLGREVIII
ncbi:unnamed protein product [Pocillopora meandrina]|uniref:Uncharacterized protein n=1 Tax=Pocillopora meandrina TaxID=46732 RepID=A0AAU9Y3W1_9CNID|nr:unnamed protein product [Pocillopora meandrina]